jgi:hypothetical protein
VPERLLRRAALEKASCPRQVPAVHDLGKAMVIFGLTVAAIGLVFWTGFGKAWLGRLPGDIHYTNPKGNFSFYFPIMTCLAISVLLTLILWLFRK